MGKLAFVEGGAREASAALVRQGWKVVDPATAPLDALAEAPDLLVGEFRSWRAEEDLRRLAAVHAMAPDLPMVIVADRLHDDEGHAVYDVLLDIPIIRCGDEETCLGPAIAAAGGA